jgi:hypothetical protein
MTPPDRQRRAFYLDAVVPSTSMPTTEAERILELEHEIQALRLRVIALERLVGSSAPEHDVDRGVVERKVTYDWQA